MEQLVKTVRVVNDVKRFDTAVDPGLATQEATAAINANNATNEKRMLACSPNAQR
jgi:hypothetical protein